MTSKTAPSAARGLPINELIAVGALLALAAWAWITWSGRGGEPVPLGPFDPGSWFPGRSLTLADLPLVVMLVLGGLPLVWNLLTKLAAGTFGADLQNGEQPASLSPSVALRIERGKAFGFGGLKQRGGSMRLEAGRTRPLGRAINEIPSRIRAAATPSAPPARQHACTPGAHVRFDYALRAERRPAATSLSSRSSAALRSSTGAIALRTSSRTTVDTGSPCWLA